MFRRTVLAAVFGLAAGASAVAAAATPPDPAAFISGLAKELQAEVSTATPEQRLAQLHSLLRQAFDVPQIARFVLGRYWWVATPQEQQEFVALFEDDIVRTYGDRLSEIGGGVSLKVTGARSDAWGAFVASQAVRKDAAFPLRIDWRVVPTGATYKITDVIVDSVSMAATERDEFAAEIQRGGGDEQSLLAMMRSKAGPLTGSSQSSVSAAPSAGG